MLDANKTDVTIALGKLGDEESKWLLKVSHDGCSATFSFYKSERDAKADDVPLLEFDALVDDDDIAHMMLRDPRHIKGTDILYVESPLRMTIGALAARVPNGPSMYLFPDAKIAVLQEPGSDPRVVCVPQYDPRSHAKLPTSHMP